MTWLIVARLVPRHAREPGPVERPTRRGITAFLTLDNFALLAATASSHLLPVIVASRAGSEAAGYFFVAWVLGTALDLALVNVASSLTVEGSREQERLGVLVRMLLRRIMMLAAPLVAVVLLTAPVILSLYGDAYASHGSALLRLVALAVVPRTIVVVWMSVQRIRRSLGPILLAQGLVSTAVLGLSALLVPHYGITAVGIVHLGAQTIAALVLAPDIRRLVNARTAVHRESTP